MLEQILPRRWPWPSRSATCPTRNCFPRKKPIIARAVARRRREFAAGRACARAALAQLGEPPVPILRGPRDAPQWPAGIAGSITHCAGYRAAAAARTAGVVTLGLDAEPDEALPAGVLDVISRPQERAQLAALAAAHPDAACWDRLLFCAKESVYKAWFPLAQEWLGFDDAEIVIDVGGTFTARLLVPGPLVNGSPLTSLGGRWLAARGLLVTAIALPA